MSKFRPAKNKIRTSHIALALCAGLSLSACTDSVSESISIDKAQGSAQNLNSLNQVVANQPNNPDAYNTRGLAYGQSGQYRNAIADFTRAISLKRTFYQAYYNRGLAFAATGSTDDALRDYNASLKINAKYDSAYIARGNLYRLNGQTAQAMRDFDRAIKLNTSNPRAYFNRAMIHQSRGAHDNAIADFSASIKQDRRASKPLARRGYSYLALNDLTNAYDDFNAALRLNDKNAEAWAGQASILEKRGEKQRARRAYQRAIIIDPSLKFARDGANRTR